MTIWLSSPLLGGQRFFLVAVGAPHVVRVVALNRVAPLLSDEEAPTQCRTK